MIKMIVVMEMMLRDRRGISAVEYGVLIGVVGVGLVAALDGVPTVIADFIEAMVGNATATPAPAG
jgi:Flp pilus assembly pilin Flp